MTIPLDPFTTILSACFGLIIGSFLNVVIARLPNDESIVKPGSRCPKCKHPIRWYQNIPVLSWLALRGKCANCKAGIAFRYPLVEIITATLFVAVKLKFGWSWVLWVRDWPFVALLVAITFIDIDHRIIPDELSLGGLVLGLVTSFATQGGIKDAAIGAAVGFGGFYFLAWSYEKYSGRQGLGGGDIKLLAMLGAYLGAMGVFATVLVSSISGSVIGIAWAAVNKQKNLMKVSVPYGPFLVIGALYYYLLGDVLWLPFIGNP